MLGLVRLNENASALMDKTLWRKGYEICVSVVARGDGLYIGVFRFWRMPPMETTAEDMKSKLGGNIIVSKSEPTPWPERAHYLARMEAFRRVDNEHCHR